MPLHQNVKSCLSQPLVSLHRLKAATKQLGREREKERGRERERERDRERQRERGRGKERETGDVVAIVTIWWV